MITAEGLISKTITLPRSCGIAWMVERIAKDGTATIRVRGNGRVFQEPINGIIESIYAGDLVIL